MSLSNQQGRGKKAGSERKERNPPWRMKPELGDRVEEESVTVLNLKLLFYTITYKQNMLKSVKHS